MTRRPPSPTRTAPLFPTPTPVRSTPTYPNWSRASEGEARTVEARASATASFRIIIPFLGCHYGQPQLPTPGLVSAQANKFRLLLPKRNKSESLECVAATALQEAIRPCARSAAITASSAARHSASIVVQIGRAHV